MEQSVGKSIERFDSVDKVTGKALFPGDINFYDQVFMSTLFSPSHHAIIKQVEFSDALKMPGVITVLTAEDVPLNEYGLIINDQPVLCGPNSSKVYSDRTRFIGDQVALIIAEDDYIAKTAARMIRVEYQALDILTDPNEALDKNAAIIHPDRESNIMFARKIDFGCINNAFKEADIVIESVYHTPAQEHVFLQPEAGIAYYDEQDRIIVHSNFVSATRATLVVGKKSRSVKKRLMINGFEYQINAAMQEIQEGALDCPQMTQTDTLANMRTLDTIRQQIGLQYPFE